MKRACIVLPTYNEAQNVRVLIPQIFDQAARIASHELHVLVVDDASPDGTAQVVRALANRYPRLHLVSGRKEGLGVAYQRGFRWAIDNLEPELLLEMDADLQHPPELLPLFVELTNYGFSLVIGSRFAPGGSTSDFALHRRMISRTGNWMIRFLGGLPRIHDCTSGFRCIRADLVDVSDLSALSARGYSFQSSLLCELLRNGARPVEIPMVFGKRGAGESKLTLRDQVEFVLNIARIRFRRSQEFVKFCAVGASGVLVNMGMYLGLTRGQGFSIELAAPVAIEMSVLSNFVLNSTWTFRDRAQDGLLARLARFHVVSGVAATLNYVVLLALVRLFGVWDVAANLAGIALGTIVNYALNSLWTWRDVAPREIPEKPADVAPPAAAEPPKRAASGGLR